MLNSYGPGSSLSGKVTKVVAFGAFVEIVPGVEGLVHISELAEHHVETPGEIVTPGEEVRVKILEIDEERRRISLSIKRVGEGGMPLRGAFEDAQAAATPVDGEAPAAVEQEPTAAAEVAEAPEAVEAAPEVPEVPEAPESEAAPEAPEAPEAAAVEPEPEPQVPELGLSEEVFSEQAAGPPAEEPAEDDPATDA